MKPLFGEEYYRNRWDSFLERVPGEHYINLESELEKAMWLMWIATMGC